MFDKLREDAREALTSSTPENDLRARLHADHVEVSKLIDELLASGDHEIDLRGDLRDQIVTSLSAHSIAEEEVVYDFLEGRGSVGLLAHSRAEHAEIDQVLNRLAGWDCTDPGVTDVVKELQERVVHHVHEEEGSVLPQAEREVGVEPLAALIAPFNRRKRELLDASARARREAEREAEREVDREAPLVWSSPGVEDSNSQF